MRYYSLNEKVGKYRIGLTIGKQEDSFVRLGIGFAEYVSASFQGFRDIRAASSKDRIHFSPQIRFVLKLSVHEGFLIEFNQPRIRITEFIPQSDHRRQ